MGRVTRKYPVVRIGPRRRPPDRHAGGRGAARGPAQRQAFSSPCGRPGDDIDLVHGLLHSEGVISHRADVSLARYCAGSGPDGLNTYNVLDVSLAGHVGRRPPELRRNVLTTSACGHLRRDHHRFGAAGRRGTRSTTPAGAGRADLAAPDLLRAQQRAFAQTGGLHAAGLIDPDGELVCVREDVGRHNAVDKVVGWALREDRLPLRQMILVVSGRASFELTQKAVLAGIPILAAVSAPSSLAVELADRGRADPGRLRPRRDDEHLHPPGPDHVGRADQGGASRLGTPRLGAVTTMLPTPRRRRSRCRLAGAGSDGQQALTDGYGRVATDLRVSLTDRCNLRCTTACRRRVWTGCRRPRCSPMRRSSG